jgi:CRP-like cAMP-binding protein
MEPIQYLRRLLPDAAGITDRTLTKFLSSLHVQRVPKGGSLTLHGLPIMGIVASGCLRVYFTESDGSDRVVYFAPEGWCVSGVTAPALVEDSPLLRVEALEATEIWMAEGARAPAFPRSRRFDRIWMALAEDTLLTMQRRLMGGLRKDAAERYVEFRRLYPGLESRIAQYHVASYLGVSPEFFSKLRRQVLRIQVPLVIAMICAARLIS